MPGVVIRITSWMHIVQGLALLLSPAAGNATSLYVLAHMMPPSILGVLLLIIGIWGLMRSGLAAIPQQTLLTFSAASAVMAAWFGHYADGTTIDSFHIVADQAPSVLLSIFYPICVMQRDW
jgi:hypothetical protein